MQTKSYQQLVWKRIEGDTTDSARRYRLQSMYNHIVGRAASVISPYYFILLAYKLHLWSLNTADVHSESLNEGVHNHFDKHKEKFK